MENNQLVLRNRQRLRPINLPFARKLALVLLEVLEVWEFELGVYFVSPTEMARLNETFLKHPGSTDVISFHYPDATDVLRGEIFISISDSMRQAREYHTTWQSEVVRYLIHGILHLKGYDDLTSVNRRVMKRLENRLLKNLSKQFSLRDLSSKRQNSKLPKG